MKQNAQSQKPAQGVLLIVENLPVPFDRRVWQEANALRQAGYMVSVICPKGKGYNDTYEQIDGIHIYRHALPVEGAGALGYLAEYGAALFWELLLSFKVLRRHGFDVIHACNPPDLIFLVAAVHKFLLGKKFIFDQHDINPELYEVKFGKRGLFHKLLLIFEKLTFRLADASIATNETFKQIAISRGGMEADKVWVVKSYPDLSRFKSMEPDMSLKRRFRFLAGYVGIMAQQDGVDLLVKAMAHIVRTHKRDDIGCIIIGDGPELENLKELAVRERVGEQVIFTGYLRGEPLLQTLCALDIGVIPDPPNACNDKLSMNKVFEYMALGLPFVQFDLRQARSEAGEASVIAAGDTPEALAQAMIDLLGDAEKRARMSRFGKAHAVKEFQWEHEKQSLLAAYESVLKA